MNENTFAKRLNYIMKKRNLRQIDIVKKTGIDKSLLNGYINGICKPKNEKLKLLSNILDVSDDWLMGYDDNEIENKSYNTIIKELLDLFLKLNDNQQEIIINLMKNMN